MIGGESALVGGGAQMGWGCTDGNTCFFVVHHFCSRSSSSQRGNRYYGSICSGTGLFQAWNVARENRTWGQTTHERPNIYANMNEVSRHSPRRILAGSGPIQEMWGQVRKFTTSKFTTE